MPKANVQPGVPLAGRGIAVTRPAGQAGHLADLIRNAGGTPVLFPVLEILEIADQAPLLALIERLDEFDLAIFISPTAVNQALRLILARRAWPKRLKIAAIGLGSARELKHFGIEKAIMPVSRSDSEALLDLPELREIAGKRVVIFRGVGGRALLGNVLASRGAILTYAECYRRAKPAGGAAALLKVWERHQLHAITVTSSEGLRNLFDMVGEAARPRLKTTPLFVPHERIGKAARELGLSNVIITGEGDEGMIQGMIDWFSKTDKRER